MVRGPDFALPLEGGQQEGRPACAGHFIVKLKYGGPTEPAVAHHEIDAAVHAGVDPVRVQLPGDFELQPGFVLSITLEEDGLHAQATGQPKFQIFASSETEFYFKVVDAQLTFMTGEDGRVDQVVLHQGGRDMPAGRMTD